MKLKRISFYALISFFAVSCGDSTTEETDINVDKTPVKDTVVSDRTEKIENIFFNIPSPLETTNILKKAGATYEWSLPNNPEVVDDYQTIKYQALNMGVYGADLNYASVFDQTTETMLYLRCAKSLGKQLGVEEVFDEETVDRIDNNVENQDSMQVIISETFWRMDSHLKEGGRESISALIVAGGWVEGVYLATQLANLAPENENLKLRIAEQKYSLENLLGLLKSYESDDVKDVIDELEDLHELFNEIEESKTPGENTTDENGVVTIGDKIELKMSEQLLKDITDRVVELRNEFTRK